MTGFVPNQGHRETGGLFSCNPLHIPVIFDRGMQRALIFNNPHYLYKTIDYTTLHKSKTGTFIAIYYDVCK